MKSTIKNHLYKIELFFGVSSVFLIAINKHLVTVFMMFWMLFAIVNHILDKTTANSTPEIKRSFFPFVLFPIFYGIHILGLIYTSNFEYAFFDLEIKLSMLLIPLLLWLRYSFYKDKQLIILRSLLFGCLFSFFLNFSLAVIHYSSSHDIAYFFYTLLSPIHPSYMALYISLALLSLVYIGSKNFFFNKKGALAMGIMSAIILILYLFLLSSKAGIIIFTLTFAVFIANRLSHKIKTRHILLIVFLIISFPMIVIHYIPSVQVRFQLLISAVSHPEKANLNSGESSLERVALYVESTKLAYHKLPFGVGTGDTKDEIAKNYIKLNAKTLNDNYLNTHNQYLQTTISLGLLGLISILSIIVLGLVVTIKKRDLLFTSFIVLFCLHFLFESMLEQQAGVIFITLFYSFFCIWGNPKLNIQA